MIDHDSKKVILKIIKIADTGSTALDYRPSLHIFGCFLDT